MAPIGQPAFGESHCPQSFHAVQKPKRGRAALVLCEFVRLAILLDDGDGDGDGGGGGSKAAAAQRNKAVNLDGMRLMRSSNLAAAFPNHSY